MVGRVVIKSCTHKLLLIFKRFCFHDQQIKIQSMRLFVRAFSKHILLDTIERADTNGFNTSSSEQISEQIHME